MPDANWNELVPEENRLESPNRNDRRPATTTPTHIVVHVTGTDSFESVKRTFMAQRSVSAHYLITKQGRLFQFVPDSDRASHAGISSTERALYGRGRATWSRYLKYFSWYKAYPRDARFVDGDLQPVWGRTEPVFVGRANEQPWPEYDYFAARWGDGNVPVNFDVDSDPNNYSIGIELLGFGSKTPDDRVYTLAMYMTLRQLVDNLSDKYAIRLVKGRVVGHEDVHPVGRFGWDPGQGFDWNGVYEPAG